MKKYLSFILISALLLSLTACRKMPDSDSGSAETSVIKEIVYVSEPEQEPQQEPQQESQQETDSVSSVEETASKKDEKAWQSTVVAPATVTFYKDGMQSVSTDKELNLKIARHIESWYKYEESISGVSLAATTDLIRTIRQNEMAIELNFDDEIKFYGGVISSNTRTLFVPLSGEYDDLIFSNTIKSPDYWGGPIATNGGTGLEQYFDCVQFVPLTEEEKRWRSTIGSAGHINFYENGSLIGEIGTYHSDYQFCYEISRHIESWFYHKEDIPTVETGIIDTTLNNIRAKESYIELWFGDDITFYGEHVVSEKSSFLIIPLTGEYAYYIFEGDYNNFSSIAYVPEGSGLEQFFERLKTADNS